MTIYDEVKNFYAEYGGKKCVIGYSFCGREIFAFHIGDDLSRQIIAAYSFHGREWICSRLAIKHIKIGARRGVWVVPLVNPDGAVISQTENPMWKANARGVDINCNFPADWGTGKLNVRTRGAENCIGDFPLSEAESFALARFTRKIYPMAALAFHTKGGEVYWEYCGKGDIRGAKLICEATGYTAKKIMGSAGGYKDWCISGLKIPSYTIECGRDSLTHPIKKLSQIRECYGILKHFTENYGS